VWEEKKTESLQENLLITERSRKNPSGYFYINILKMNMYLFIFCFTLKVTNSCYICTQRSYQNIFSLLILFSLFIPLFNYLFTFFDGQLMCSANILSTGGLNYFPPVAGIFLVLISV
jgi:hypothetical protein